MAQGQLDAPSGGLRGCAGYLPGGGGGILSKGFCCEQGRGRVGHGGEREDGQTSAAGRAAPLALEGAVRPTVEKR